MRKHNRMTLQLFCRWPSIIFKIFQSLNTLKQMFLERLKIIFMNRLNCTLNIIAYNFVIFMFCVLVTICFTSSHLSYKFMDQLFLFFFLCWVSYTHRIFMFLRMRMFYQIFITLSFLQYFL